MNGIVYYNSGMSCLIRMVVSMFSLRQVYDGDILLYYPKRDVNVQTFAIKTCERIAEHFDCGIQVLDLDVPPGKNLVFLERTKYHTVTPFDVSVSLDSDTVVLSPRIIEFIATAKEHEFSIAHFANWGTQGGVVSKRIKYWNQHHPNLVGPALDYGSAINCGCFGFRKDSQIMKVWYDRAVVGRESFIADETCMQLLLPKYPHKLLESAFNCSCKYDDKIDDPAYPVVVHFHGKKHCRFSDEGFPLHHSLIWLYYFEQCLIQGVFDKVGMNVLENDYDDKMYRKHKNNIFDIVKTKS